MSMRVLIVADHEKLAGNAPRPLYEPFAPAVDLSTDERGRCQRAPSEAP